MNEKHLSAKEFTDRIGGKKVLVIGDVMVDQYLTGSTNRISPEAPVPILLHNHTTLLPGGAANVALNLSGLGAKVWIASVVGRDEMGEKLVQLLSENDIHTDLILASEHRMTTCKTRVMAGKQHLLRVDRERIEPIQEFLLRRLLKMLNNILEQHRFDVVIMQDYNKGILSEESIAAFLDTFNSWSIPVAVDPKYDNFYLYRKVALFKPNLAEIRASLPFPLEIEKDSLDRAADHLRSKLQCDMIMITLSDQGIYLNSRVESIWLPTQKRLIADVCGAGDTVISAAALALAEKLSMMDIAYWSGYCGTLVCQYPGVKPVSRSMILEQK
ncbi:MAG: carbohydrate kinase [Saprospiraceae bacterium]|nr:carbohydrate kinase [Saprospiraceae bacterium]